MKSIIIFLAVLFLTEYSAAQVNCTGGTPFFTVDLTGNPAGVWTSPAVQRAGSCCGGGANQTNCIELSITLDPNAEGIIFNVASGANPGGALYYQVNCVGVPAASGSAALCLNGVGPHLITYCKVGNNTNTYSITSVPAPSTTGDVITADGCTDTLTVLGVTQASATWTSISPGTSGQYNNYLNNLAGSQPGVSGTAYTGQTTVVVTPQPGYPSSIQYRVCGTVIGGCSVASFCDTVTVSIFPTLFAQINPVNPAICFGSPGTTLTAVPIGGTAPFNYLWSGPSNNGATTSTILASAPGVYTLNITDATGCPAAVATVTVTQFANTITANAGPDITICRSPIPTIAINGTVTGVTTGIWSGGAGTYNPSNTSLTLNYTPTAAELAAGTVTLTLTTTNNGSCPGASDQVVITLPQFTSTLSTVPTHISCNGLTNGAIDLTVTGGFAPASYLWSNGATTQDLINLGVGTYTVTVTDVNGCTANISRVITQPTVLTSAITAQTNVSCFGGSNGSVTVTASGGTAPYQFSINAGPNQGSGTFSGLIAGSYTVTITDAQGCIRNQAVTITQPLAPLTVSTTQTNILCFGASTGAINLTPAGGTAPYTFSWSNGATTEDLSGIPAGTYTVIVNDANGSTGGCTATTTVTITQPAAALTLSSTHVNILCFGGSTGSIDLTPAGGTAPYTYSWSNGATTQDLSGLTAGTYTVNVNDANGLAGSCAATRTIIVTQPTAPLTLTSTRVNVLCNGGLTGSINLTPAGGTAPYTYSWSNGATTEDLSGLAAGTYTVIVNDANGSTGGCTATTLVTITQPLAPLTVSTTQTNVLCFGASTGAINLTPAGGTAPYTFSWSNGATTEDLSGIPAGTYTVIVNDANGSTGGCTATTTVTITQPAAALTLSSTHVNILCFGGSTGSIDLTPAGGTAPYTYSWSNGATTQDLSGLTAGTYTVNVNDANGSAGSCAATRTIIVTQPAAPLTLTSTRVNVLCNGGLTGSINLTPAGGTPPYTYSWSNGATTEDLSGLAAGTYTVVVNDANGSTGGCTASTTVTITQPAAPLTVTTTQTNVLCFGASTGAINLTPAGGTAPYTYSWSNGATTEDLSGIPAGTYTVIVNDANGSTGGCTATTTVTITQPAAALTLSSTHVNILCFGGSTGSIDLTPAGGTAPYTYSWSNGATTQDLSGLTAGTYTVNVNDANGSAGSCAATRTIIVTQPTAPLTLTSTRVNVLCNGGLTGSINLTPAGGTAPYTYSWSNGATTEDLSGLAAGTYTVIVTDANGSTGGCTATTTVTITQPVAPLTVTTTQTNVLCNGSLTGAINLTPAGGTAPYTFSWSNGATTEDLSGIPAGTYTVVVNDANGSTGGCTATTTVTITQPAAPLTLSFTQVNVLCNGASTGSIDLTPAGGTPAYSYTWSNGATTQDLSGLAAGVYTVNVRDVNGSTAGCAASVTVTITQPTALTQTISAFLYPSGTNISCFGLTDGSVNLTIGGGNPGYTYAWSNGAVTEDLTNVGAGTYNVTVTDLNGCTINSSITLTQPALLTSGLVPSVYVGGFNTTGCLSNGTIDLSVAGGNPGYSYSWSNGATTQDLSAIPAGPYSVTVTDINGCQTVSNITLTSPTPLTQTITAFVYPSGTNISCFGLSDGSIDLTIGGGSPLYSYSWSNGATTQDLTNVPAGTYNVTVTDANGCQITSSITLTQPTVLTTGLTPSVYAGGFNVSGCIADGFIDLTVAGGNPGYTYNWSNGAVTQNVNTLIGGNYIVTVTDLNGCQSSSAITLTQPSTLNQTISATTFPSGTNISCFGLSDGNIDLTIDGGTPGYSYLWNTGATSEDLTNMPAGTYSVIITDANGCQVSSSITLTQPPALSQTITATIYQSGTNISCFGLSNGNVDLTINGGNPGYTYTWSNGAVTQDLSNVPAGAYSVTVTDVNGCTIASNITLVQPTVLTQAISATTFPSGTNISCFGLSDGNIDLTIGGGNPGYTYVWSNGALTQDLSNMPAGTYNVTVTDVNGCTIPSTITLTQPAILTQGITSPTFPSGTNISCFGFNDGSVDLTIGGGNPGYTYVWSNGAATQDLTNLIAGTYNVTITDINGCSIPSTITLTQPTVLTQNISAFIYPSGTNISCFGLSDGSVDLTINGGNPGYSYTWSNGAVTQDLTNIPAGAYSVTVTDINGCIITSNITLVQPTVLTQGITATTFPSGTNISCFGLSDGNIDLTIGGGNPGYTYVWSNGALTQDLSNMPAGIYNVTVTDVNGCTIPSTITLTEPTALTEGITSPTFPSGTNISCFGFNDGSIDLTIGGGNPGYTYVWSNGAATQDLTNLVAGTYDVTVTDINGCSIPSTITLTQPIAITQNISAFIYPSGTNISCFGLSDGSVDLTIAGGNAGYTYVWSNGATTQDLTGVAAGTYSVTITDMNGCIIPSTITLTQPTLLSSGVVPFVYPGGFNVSGCAPDGSINLTVTGGNPGYTYVWSNGSNNEDISALPVGAYSVTITDINGCQTTSSTTLTGPPAMTENVTAFTYPSGTNISCNGLSDGSIDLTIGGGVAPYTYLWNTGATTQDLTNVPAGVYNVTATDLNGCEIFSTITLTQPTALTQTVTAFTYPSGSNISCFGLSDGSIDLTIGGGNPSYSYTWSNGATTQDLSGIPAGTYSVLVTDINGCTIPSSITLVQPTALSEGTTAFVYPSGNNISCFGFSDGSVNLTIAGGSAGYTYLWSNGAVTQDISGLTAGTYTVTTTDVNGCTINSSITLNEPTVLTQTISAFTYPSGTNISCFGLNDGSIDLTVNNGSPTYTYNWSNGATTQDLTNLLAGTYSVVITDVNGCVLPSTITLVEPSVLTQGVTAFTYPSGNNISCFGLSDGSIDLTIGGGNPGYSYLWNTGAVTQDLSSLPAGSYSVLVTDINGCTIASGITLNQPTILTQGTSSPTFIGGNNISCFGLSDGSIDLTIGGGSPGYTYLWNNGLTTQDLTGLPIGTYDVTATDINGCQISGSITLTEPTPLAYSQVVSSYAGGFNVTGCDNDGTIDLTVTGSIPNYSYSWSNGSPTQDLANLFAGTYSVTISDANGCQLIVDTTLVAAPVVGTTTQVDSDYNGQDISCFGASDGSISVTPSGGVPGYTYQWTNIFNAPISTNQNVTGLPSGLYTVVVTDQNGCTSTATVTLVDPPAYNFGVVVSTDYNGQDISCFGASDGGIDLTVTGATPAYNYNWTNSSGTTVSTAQDPTGLPAGVYNVLTTDLNGCTFNTAITLTEPPVLFGVPDVTSNYNGQDVSCFESTDGSLTVVPSGGTPTYSYQWINSAGNVIGSGIDQTNIGAGIYQVVITDVNGCSFSAPVVVTQPAELITTPIIISNYFGQAVSCVGATDGIVNTYTTGGTVAYSYSWNTTPVTTTAQASNLGVGTTTVIVTDLNNCIATASVILSANPTPNFNIPDVVYSCEGNAVTINSQSEANSSCTWIFSDGQVINECGPIDVSFPSQEACYDMQLTVINPLGCISSVSITNFICVVSNPNASFTAADYTLSTTNPDTYFYNNSMGASTYFWDFGDGTNSTATSPYHLFPSDLGVDNFDVWLYAISEYGCIDSTVRNIEMKEDLIVYVPNTFTPDGDEYNNQFIPVLSSGYSTQGYSLFIFNRWGELIFESHDTTVGWDGTYNGKMSQTGTYTWKLIVKDDEDDDKTVFVGHVNLIR